MRRTLSAGLGARRAQRTPRLSRAAAMIGPPGDWREALTSLRLYRGFGGELERRGWTGRSGRGGPCRGPRVPSSSAPGSAICVAPAPAAAAWLGAGLRRASRWNASRPRPAAQVGPVPGLRGPGPGRRGPGRTGAQTLGRPSPPLPLGAPRPCAAHAPRRGAYVAHAPRRAFPPPSEICVPRLVPPSAPGAPGPTRFITPGGRPGQHFTTSPGSDVAGARRGVPPVIRMFPRRIDCF